MSFFWTPRPQTAWDAIQYSTGNSGTVAEASTISRAGHPVQYCTEKPHPGPLLSALRILDTAALFYLGRQETGQWRHWGGLSTEDSGHGELWVHRDTEHQKQYIGILSAGGTRVFVVGTLSTVLATLGGLSITDSGDGEFWVCRDSVLETMGIQSAGDTRGTELWRHCRKRVLDTTGDGCTVCTVVLVTPRRMEGLICCAVQCPVPFVRLTDRFQCQ